MKKIAIFVEGQTELEFVKKLLQEVAGELAIAFFQESWHAKQFIALRGGTPHGNERYFALLVDCQGDNGVKSAILDRRANLIKAGYNLILGLRDLYPKDRTDLALLRKGLAHGLPQANLPTHIVVAVMEIEAWFAQEEFHYLQIDVSLTKQFIRTNYGFDLDVDCGESLSWPSDFIDQVYKSAGKRYRKKMHQINRTVRALDYSNLYLNLRARLSTFNEFSDYLDQFLAP